MPLIIPAIHNHRDSSFESISFPIRMVLAIVGPVMDYIQPHTEKKARCIIEKITAGICQVPTISLSF